jgi:hypothetical protein
VLSTIVPTPIIPLVVMELKKQGTWHMFPDFHTLNKLTIKENFHITFIDDLLDELSGS